MLQYSLNYANARKIKEIHNIYLQNLKLIYDKKILKFIYLFSLIFFRKQVPSGEEKQTNQKNKWKNNAWLSNLHITKTKILQNPEFFFPKNCFFFFCPTKGFPFFCQIGMHRKKGKKEKKTIST